MGLRETFQVLAENDSPLTREIALAAFEEESAFVLEHAVHFFLKKESKRGIEEMARHFHRCPPALQQFILRDCRRLPPALRDFFSRADAQTKLNIVEMSERLRRQDLCDIFVRGMTQEESEELRERSEVALDAIARRMARQQRSERNRARPPKEDLLRVRRMAVMEALRDALKNFPRHSKSFVFARLAEMGGDGLDLLAALLKGGETTTYRAMLHELEYSREPAMAGFLVWLSAHRDRSLRELAFKLIGRRHPSALGRPLVLFFRELDDVSLRQMAGTTARVLWWEAWASEVSGLRTEEAAKMLAFLAESRLPDQERIACMAELLRASEAEVRAAVVRTLGREDLPEVLDHIQGVLEDEAEPVQRAAMEYILERKPPGWLQLLTPLLNSAHQQVRSAVGREISRDSFERYLRSFDRLDDRTREMAGQAIAKLDPTMAERLAEELHALDPERRIKALRIIDIAGKEKDLEPILLELINDPDLKVRATVVKTIGLLGSIPAIRCLIRALSDPDRRTRANAVEAFEALGDSKLGSLLLPFLQDPDNRVRANTVKALWNLGYQETQDVLEGMLREEHELMRLSAVWALGEINYPTARDILERVAQEDSSERVRAKARDTMAKLSDGESR